MYSTDAESTEELWQDALEYQPIKSIPKYHKPTSYMKSASLYASKPATALPESPEPRYDAFPQLVKEDTDLHGSSDQKPSVMLEMQARALYCWRESTSKL